MSHSGSQRLLDTQILTIFDFIHLCYCLLLFRNDILPPFTMISGIGRIIIIIRHIVTHTQTSIGSFLLMAPE